MKNTLRSLSFVVLLGIVPACGLVDFFLDDASEQKVEAYDEAIEEQDAKAKETEDKAQEAITSATTALKAKDFDGFQELMTQFDDLTKIWQAQATETNRLIQDRNDYVQGKLTEGTGPIIDILSGISPLAAVVGTLLAGLLARFGSKKSSGQMRSAAKNLVKFQCLAALDELGKALGVKHTNKTAAELLTAAKLVAFKEGDKALIAKLDGLDPTEAK